MLKLRVNKAKTKLLGDLLRNWTKASKRQIPNGTVLLTQYRSLLYFLLGKCFQKNNKSLSALYLYSSANLLGSANQNAHYI